MRLYEILGLEPQATPREISWAYWRIMDRLSDIESGCTFLNLISIRFRYEYAHDVLSDPKRRKNYELSPHYVDEMFTPPPII